MNNNAIDIIRTCWEKSHEINWNIKKLYLTNYLYIKDIDNLHDILRRNLNQIVSPDINIILYSCKFRIEKFSEVNNMTLYLL